MRQWRVREVMTNQVLVVAVDAGPAEALARMAERDVSALAVVDDFDQVIGVLTRSDLLNAMTWREDRDAGPELGWRHGSVRRMMSVPAVTVGPDATLAAAGRRMATAGVKRLLVTDHRRRLLGVVAAADLLRVYARPDDAVRADVRDALESAGSERVRIDVHDGVVTLTGPVPDRATARLLKNLAQAVPGAAEVVTELRPPATATNDPAGAEAERGRIMDGWWVARRRTGAARVPPPMRWKTRLSRAGSRGDHDVVAVVPGLRVERPAARDQGEPRGAVAGEVLR